eukprot:1140915-Pelagomonas_calceolata.AAC.1
MRARVLSPNVQERNLGPRNSPSIIYYYSPMPGNTVSTDLAKGREGKSYIAKVGMPVIKSD